MIPTASALMFTVAALAATPALGLPDAAMSARVTQTGSVCVVRLAWDANTEADLAGYKLAWSLTSRVYESEQVIADKAATSTDVVAGACDGKARFFALRAFNAAGLTSGYSNEVRVVLSEPAPTTRKPNPTKNTIASPVP